MIPGSFLELCQLEIKQLSPEILKFSTRQEDNPFSLNCDMVPRTFLFIFHADLRRLGSNNFWDSSYVFSGFYDYDLSQLKCSIYHLPIEKNMLYWKL